ncbi:MAG: hypothetical protein QN178_06320 [Armatimonadota bacterium]|nr:hypothetical protein [Armatimonadota bacterium]
MTAMPSLAGVGAQLSVVRSLTALIVRPCTPRSARALIRRRLRERRELFLATVRDCVWAYPASPYRQLMEAMGWTLDRLIEHVRRHGVEATLVALRDAGVYLTHDEFKGRRPVVRGGFRLEVTEADFDNPAVHPAFEIRTGGTRTLGGSRVPATFDYMSQQRAPVWCLSLEALGASDWPVIVWMPAVTHGGGLGWWLALLHMGRPALRWFSITNPDDEAIPTRHRLLFRLAQRVGRLRGLRVPYPEHAALNDADVVLDAVVEARRRAGGCAVISSPSAATRLAAAAAQRGTDLQHVALLVGAEPLTPGKHEEIIKSGARVGVRYVLTEAGAVGGTCGNPEAIDDLHFVADAFAMILTPRVLPDGQTAKAFVLTTLLPTSPKVLLNVESDDFGQVTERRCGCLWDELGLHTHLSTIRSFSKLTGEGVTILGSDVVRILEEVLPRAFGGQSTDYQLVEAEDGDRLTRLYLYVSPAIGPVDEDRVRQRFIDELRDPTRPRSLMPPLWRQAETIRVLRRAPVPTVRGKLLPFHTLAQSGSALDRNGPASGPDSQGV